MFSLLPVRVEGVEVGCDGGVEAPSVSGFELVLALWKKLRISFGGGI